MHGLIGACMFQQGASFLLWRFWRQGRHVMYSVCASKPRKNWEVITLISQRKVATERMGTTGWEAIWWRVQYKQAHITSVVKRDVQMAWMIWVRRHSLSYTSAIAIWIHVAKLSHSLVGVLKGDFPNCQEKELTCRNTGFYLCESIGILLLTMHALEISHSSAAEQRVRGSAPCFLSFTMEFKCFLSSSSHPALWSIQSKRETSFCHFRHRHQHDSGFVHTLKFIFISGRIVFGVAFLNILSLCPPLYRLFPAKRKKYSAMGKTGYDIEGYIWTYTKLFTMFAMLGNMFKEIFYRTAEKNKKAPNPNVLTSDGQKEVKLLDSAQPGQPLVLNFGSCSWPPFIAELADFKKIVADFADIADFTTIYISEAHSTDGWNFPGNIYKIKQHTSLQERLLAASILLEDDELTPPGTFLVDNMDDKASLMYGAKPERLT